MLQESINKEKEALSSIADEVRKNEEIRDAENLATEVEAQINSIEQSVAFAANIKEKLEIDETNIGFTDNVDQSGDFDEVDNKQKIQSKVSELQERRSILEKSSVDEEEEKK